MMSSTSSTLESNVETASSGIRRVSTQSGNIGQPASTRTESKWVSGPRGCSLILIGNLEASEDLAVDGTIQGNIDLQGHNLTINPTGIVHGNIYADTVVVHGTVRGNISAADHLELRRTGIAVGDLIVSGIIIHDGAYFKGSIDIRRRKEIEEAKIELMAKQSEPMSQSVHLNSRFHELMDKKLVYKQTEEEFRELQEIERLIDESELKLVEENYATSGNLHLQLTSKLTELIDELKSFSTSKPPG